MIRTEIDSMPAGAGRHSPQDHAAGNRRGGAEEGRRTSSRRRIWKRYRRSLLSQREHFNAMKAKWENEKNAIAKVQKLREEIEQHQCRH